MRKILKGSIFLSLVLNATLGVADNSHHHNEARFKVIEIKPGFSFLQGKGGNVLASTGEDGILIVDSDYRDLTSSLQKALTTLDGELKYVLNTHWHGDHTQGNLELGKKATIVAHDKVRERLNSRQEIKLFNMVSEPYPKHALPSITFNDSLTLHINNETIEAVYAKDGHTDGDSVVFFKNANIVHMGDHFFNGFFPFVDVGSKGSVLRMARNIENLLDRIDDKTVVVPGHGPLANKQDLLSFRNMLVETSSEVRKMKDAGKSLSEIQSAGLSEKWESWGGGFLNESTWIGIVHSSLIADAK